MTRRIVAVAAWLMVAAMNALWVWAVAWGGFLDTMFASLSVEEQRLLTPGMLADAERTAIDFAERLRDEVDVDHLRTALAATAGGAVDPTGVGVWLRPTPGTTR